eukprot:1524727-Lingulodinium_polyedra.AAC.1
MSKITRSSRNRNATKSRRIATGGTHAKHQQQLIAQMAQFETLNLGRLINTERMDTNADADH